MAVLHHVIADGLGRLNVLAALVDPGMPSTGVPFPQLDSLKSSLQMR